MDREIRRRVIVQPGGRIEVEAPELPDGTTAEIVIRFDDTQLAKRGFCWYVGRGAGAFGSPQEVDEFLERERSGWD
jgi:hypothetical protein